MAITVGPRLESFFAQPLPTIIATLNQRGQPEMTPVWYEFSDGFIWLNGDQTRTWLSRMRETGRAALFVLDPQNTWRWVQVYGRVIAITEDEGEHQIGRLAQRYTGRDFRGQRGTRRTVKIGIASIKGADGSPGVQWDITRS